MTETSYLFCISRAAAGQALRSLKHEILANENLLPEELSRLLLAIHKRHAHLNALACGVTTATLSQPSRL